MKKLEKLTSEEIKQKTSSMQIRYETSATLSGPDWIQTKEDFERTIQNATHERILEKSDYYQITGYENGVRVVPYEQAKGGTIKVHSIKVNFFSRNMEKNE